MAEGNDEGKLMELALDAIAQAVRNEGEVVEVTTIPTAFMKVRDARRLRCRKS